MRYGVIDLGSNTIRAVVYETEGKSFKKLISERSFTGILNYIEDGALRPDGIGAIHESVARMCNLCRLLGCAEIHAFATASLRGVNNAAQVCDALSDTGVQVRILTGEEEAACDFAGLMAANPSPDGLGLDLGGGSCQVFCYAARTLTASASFPIGSLAMYKRFVRGVIPTRREQKLICSHVQGLIDAEEIRTGRAFDTIFAIGGTARAAGKLHRALTGQSRPIDGYPLTCSQMDDLCELMGSPDLHGLRLMERVAPERITTIVPGLLVLRTVCLALGATQIQVVKNGVREGYLCRYLLK